jgi:hypothetical protein
MNGLIFGGVDHAGLDVLISPFFLLPPQEKRVLACALERFGAQACP